MTLRRDRASLIFDFRKVTEIFRGVLECHRRETDVTDRDVTDRERLEEYDEIGTIRGTRRNLCGLCEAGVPET